MAKNSRINTGSRFVQKPRKCFTSLPNSEAYTVRTCRVNCRRIFLLGVFSSCHDRVDYTPPSQVLRIRHLGLNWGNLPNINPIKNAPVATLFNLVCAMQFYKKFLITYSIVRGLHILKVVGNEKMGGREGVKCYDMMPDRGNRCLFTIWTWSFRVKCRISFSAVFSNMNMRLLWH